MQEVEETAPAVRLKLLERPRSKEVRDVKKDARGAWAKLKEKVVDDETFFKRMKAARTGKRLRQRQ